MVLGSTFGTGQVLWSIIWFTLFFIWIWLFISVVADIFRSQDLGGFAKVLWIIVVAFLPYFGVFIYLIARGHKMAEHAMEAAQAQDAAARAYVQSVAGAPSAAEELQKLADLKSSGAISDAEFESMKAKIIAS